MKVKVLGQVIESAMLEHRGGITWVVQEDRDGLPVTNIPRGEPYENLPIKITGITAIRGRNYCFEHRNVMEPSPYDVMMDIEMYLEHVEEVVS